MINKYLIILFLLIFGTSCMFLYTLEAQEELRDGGLRLSLVDVTKIALRNNIDIKIARFDTLIKEQDLDDSKSIFDTVLDSSIGYEVDSRKRASTLSGTKTTTTDFDLGLEKKLETGTTVGADFSVGRDTSDSAFAAVNPSYEPEVGFSIKQEFGRNFFGITDRGEVAITRLDIENVTEKSLDAIEDSIASAQKAYWEVALAKERRKIKEDMLKRAQDLLKANEGRFDMGSVEETDLLASKANAEQRKSDLLVAEDEAKSKVEELLLILNLEAGIPLTLKDDLDIEGSGRADLKLSMNNAIESRRDYKRSKNEIESNKIKIKMKRTDLWPQLDLEGTLAVNGLDEKYNDSLKDVTRDNYKYYIGINVSMPLENREARSAYEKAKLEKAKAIVSLQQVERKILTDIDKRVRAVNVALNVLEHQMLVEGYQSNKLDEEMQKYNRGRSDTDTLVRFQEHLLTAQLATAQAALGYKTAIIDLAATEDTLLQKAEGAR
ncbi:MAG: TolC family protein [Candidatus Omnitrophica bacterium]|nr:TolC family protein [Candidatus Omnitrophota bacterium]